MEGSETIHRRWWAVSVNPEAARLRNLAMTLCPSRADAAALLREVANELDRGPADAHLREAAEREAVRLRSQGFTVTGARLEVRTIAAGALLSRSAGTLRNWRCAGVGPEWRSDGGVAWYSLPALLAWRASRSVTISTPDVVTG